MQHLSVFGISEELSELYIVDETPDINETRDDEEKEGIDRYTVDDEEENEYNTTFSQTTPLLYMGHEEKRREGITPNEIEEADDELNLDNFRQDDVEMIEYRDTACDAYFSIALNENALLEYKRDSLTIEYEKPEMINGQKTYQRIAFEAKEDGDVYGLTTMNFDEAGIDFASEYDGEFDSRLLTSINNKTEGAEGNFNEFYLNGEIGENAADLQNVKKGDIIEWRYAEETDGSCGGVPDHEQIKSLLVYNSVVKDGLPLSFNPNNMYALAA